MNDDEALASTERADPRSSALDTLDTRDLVALLACVGHEAVDAVVAQSSALADVIDDVVQRVQRGGRLHYVGAGTSGRLGVLDASEMPPTFGTAPELVCAHIAGGEAALRAAIEGAEDDAAAGRREMLGHVAAGDAVVAISASGNAAFAVGALAQAREIGALTVALVNVEICALSECADRVVALRTGAEILTGSTRLKAGTAQKIALNTLSTAVMVRLGRVYEHWMVDLVASNHKLQARARRMVEHLADVQPERAEELLRLAGGHVKTAVLMSRCGLSAAQATARLAQYHGRLRDAL